MLFAVKTPKGHSDGYNVNYFELIDFNSGSLKHMFYPENLGAYMEKIWGKDLVYYLSEFLPDGYIIYDHFIPEKKYSNIVLYDYYNSKIIDESEPVIHTKPKYFYDLSTDNKIWVIFMENTTTISFLSIDQKIEKKYTLNKNGENSFIFNEEIGLRLISYVGDQELKRGLHGIYEPVSSVVFNPIIHDDLLLVADKYKNLIILNLSKGGTQEKKYSVIQIKNNMLTDDDKKYLGQFLPIQDLNKFYIDL